MTLTLWLGFYGAILSTILAVREIRKSVHRVKVHCSYDVILAMPVIPAVRIYIVNAGHRPVEIVGAGFHTNQRQRIVCLSTILGKFELPKRLEDGGTATVHFIKADLKKTIAGLKPGERIQRTFAYDSVGNNHWGKLPDDFTEYMAKD